MDYFTKHHPPKHHVNVRSEFLTKVKDLAEARRQRQEQSQTTFKSAKKLISYKGVLDFSVSTYIRKPHRR